MPQRQKPAWCVARCAASPVPANAGALPVRAPVPLGHGGRPASPRALFSRAVQIALTPSRGPPWWAASLRRPFLNHRTPAQASAAGRRPAPAGWTTGRRAAFPWPCRRSQENRKELLFLFRFPLHPSTFESGGGWGCGWWWRALVHRPKAAGGGSRPLPYAAGRPTGRGPSAFRPCICTHCVVIC